MSGVAALREGVVAMNTSDSGICNGNYAGV